MNQRLDDKIMKVEVVGGFQPPELRENVYLAPNS
jgi:hypothetical protein